MFELRSTYKFLEPNICGESGAIGKMHRTEAIIPERIFISDYEAVVLLYLSILVLEIDRPDEFRGAHQSGNHCALSE